MHELSRWSFETNYGIFSCDMIGRRDKITRVCFRWFNYILFTLLFYEFIIKLRIKKLMSLDLLKCENFHDDDWCFTATCAHGRAERPPNVLKPSQRWNNLQICPRRYSNRGGSDLWSNTLSLDYEGALHIFNEFSHISIVYENWEHQTISIWTVMMMIVVLQLPLCTW